MPFRRPWAVKTRFPAFESTTSKPLIRKRPCEAHSQKGRDAMMQQYEEQVPGARITLVKSIARITRQGRTGDRYVWGLGQARTNRTTTWPAEPETNGLLDVPWDPHEAVTLRPQDARLQLGDIVTVVWAFPDNLRLGKRLVAIRDYTSGKVTPLSGPRVHHQDRWPRVEEIISRRPPRAVLATLAAGVLGVCACTIAIWILAQQPADAAMSALWTERLMICAAIFGFGVIPAGLACWAAAIWHRHHRVKTRSMELVEEWF